MDVIEPGRDDLQGVGNCDADTLGTVIKCHYSHLVKIGDVRYEM